MSQSVAAVAATGIRRQVEPAVRSQRAPAQAATVATGAAVAGHAEKDGQGLRCPETREPEVELRALRHSRQQQAAAVLVRRGRRQCSRGQQMQPCRCLGVSHVQRRDRVITDREAGDLRLPGRIGIERRHIRRDGRGWLWAGEQQIDQTTQAPPRRSRKRLNGMDGMKHVGCVQLIAETKERIRQRDAERRVLWVSRCRLGARLRCEYDVCGRVQRPGSLGRVAPVLGVEQIEGLGGFDQ